ncbi:hypothetical protein TIFTF001_023163 [Ficus carica]|uniref:Zinc finger PMZ-type domain-containing protein n=1 Tax=Ficus carica TaxID=3494 RepID=A0AA88AZX5_FICCA|nr:hypothetical protein TIFTF001_023163 [Ficus carica]
MDEICVFVKYNGQWDGTLRYVGGEMKEILVPEIATYVGLIELVRSAIGIRGPAKTIVMRYGVEPGMPLVRIQCDADVKFYIQLKKKDVHVLSKFSITIDVLDESAAEAMPPEVGESNHIDVQRSREGVQSNEAMQHVDDSNLIILPPPPHIPSPTIGLNLHTEYGIEKQHQVLNNDLCTAHGDCNAGNINIVDDARQSNKNSIASSIRAHSIANNTTSQSVNVPSSDSVSGPVVIVDYTPVTMRINCIFENKKLLQYHLHHDVMSKHYQFNVNMSNSTILHVICINNDGCPWQLRATRMRGSELFVVKRYDDVHTCSIEIVQGHHRQAKSWMIVECVKEATLTSLRDDDAESYNVLPAWAEMVKRKNHAFNIHIEIDSGNCLQYFYMCLAASKHGWPYCRPVIVVDESTLKAKFGGMLLAAYGHDVNGCIFSLAFESLAIVADRHKGIEYAANLLYPDAAFGICVQHLAANLKTRYKDFKGPLKTYFDGASRSYLLSEHHRHMESIRSHNPDMHQYLVLMLVRFLVEWLRELLQIWFVERREEALKITLKLAPKAEKLIRTNFSLGLTVTPRSADQFEYSVTNNAGQIWIVDMSERTCTYRRFQVDQIPCPHAMAVCNYRRIDPYNYFSNYYIKDYLYACYSSVVHPIGNAEGWDVPEEVRSQIVNPPITKRGHSRPRVRRILSQNEEHEPIRCGRCNGYGHNRQTCTNSVPLRVHPTTRSQQSFTTPSS